MQEHECLGEYSPLRRYATYSAVAALAVVMALGSAALLGGGEQNTADAQPKPRVFDHTRPQHQMECGACHVPSQKKRGRVTQFNIEVRGGPRGQQHQPCANSGCHDDLTFGSQITKEGANVCLSCHYHKAKVARTAPVARRRGVSNYVLDSFDHGDHIKRAGGGCETCHVPSKETRLYDRTAVRRDMTMPGHTECGTCHEKLSPSVTNTNDCQGCHMQINIGNVSPGSYADMDNYRVTMAFKPTRSRGGVKEPMSAFHKAHQKVSKIKASCDSCHNNVATKVGGVVPLPGKDACRDCHNDKQAFGMTSTDCTRCHVVPEGGF